MATRAEISAAAAALGMKGGRVKSAAKTEAVRKNAKLGGRPRKPVNTLLLQAARRASAASFELLAADLNGDRRRFERAKIRLELAGRGLDLAIQAAEAEHQRGAKARR